MSVPVVSVLMSVYNGERYLREAVDSILSQTFTDFEFIIIDDGSTDGTWGILNGYDDPRIRLLRNEENIGLTRSLNKGLALVQGEYIARMDADDISLPERFVRQVQYLEAHPSVGVLGTWIEHIDQTGASQGNWCTPTLPGVIGWYLIFGTCLAHPSVIMRREVIKQIGSYCPAVLCAQDYDLWARASVVTRIANVPEMLLQRRSWEGNIASRHSQAQEQTVVNVMRAMTTRLLGSEVSAEAVAGLRQMVVGLPLKNLQQIELAVCLIQQLYRAYMDVSALNCAEAREVAQDAGRKLYALAVLASRVSLWKGLVILIQSLRLNPQWLPMWIITKAMAVIQGFGIGHG